MLLIRSIQCNKPTSMLFELFSGAWGNGYLTTGRRSTLSPDGDALPWTGGDHFKWTEAFDDATRDDADTP